MRPVRAILDNSPKAPSPLIAAIASLGVDVIRGQWQPDASVLGRIDACFVSFYDCLKRPTDVWRLKRSLARHAIPLVTWNRDAPGYMNKSAWRLALLERAKLIDLYASHSLADGRRFSRTQLLLQNAAMTEVYHLGGLRLEELDDPARYRYDVSFFGSLFASAMSSATLFAATAGCTTSTFGKAATMATGVKSVSALNFSG